LKHRITNAASEGMNSLVARVIANARGLRSFRTLRVRVLFFLSGPEQNRTETVQNRTGRRNKTGFLRFATAIDW